MPDNLSFLPFFITEDLFLLPEDRQKRNGSSENTAAATIDTAEARTASSLKETPATPVLAAQKQPPAASRASEETTKEEANPKLVFGKNHKKLLILVEDATHPVMERADGLFLKDVLKAIGYTFDDVAIVNIAHCRNQADWEMVNAIPFTQLFSFGVSHPQLPVTRTLAPYELEGNGDKQFLLTDNLSTLRTERTHKITLWNLLKQMFV